MSIYENGCGVNIFYYAFDQAEVLNFPDFIFRL